MAFDSIQDVVFIQWRGRPPAGTSGAGRDRQPGGWSDSILSSFIGPAVKERFPGCRTTLVTSSRLKDWGGCLHFDRVAYFGDRKWEAFRLWNFLRRENFDVGIDLGVASGIGSQDIARLLKWARVPRIESLASVEGMHDSAGPNRLEAYLSLLEKLDVKPSKLNFRLKVRTHVHEEMMRKLAGAEMRAKNFFVLAPGGGHVFRHKRWSHYAELIRLLCTRTDLPILLLGGEEDLELAASLTAVDPSRVHSWIGKLSREETLAVIGECAGFVGNDSGPAYAAGGTGVPAVVLVGPTDVRRKFPPGKDLTLTCIEGRVPCSPCEKSQGDFDWSCRDNACMKNISPQQVWRELARRVGISS